MKKFLYVLVAVVLIYVINSKFVELAYSVGFAEIKKEAVLINAEKMQVKCRSYALGWVDQVKLENNFQKCMNEHQSNGYKLMKS